jgi:hypothetical protein
MGMISIKELSVEAETSVQQKWWVRMAIPSFKKISQEKLKCGYVRCKTRNSRTKRVSN